MNCEQCTIAGFAQWNRTSNDLRFSNLETNELLEKSMNLASFLETWGDSNVLAMAGAMVGFTFGLAAQRSRFCARAAVVECCEGQTGERFSVWWLAFGAALVGVQVLVFLGWLKPSDARYIGATGSISGAVLGGLLFGAGMILTRGCASRLLILSGNGNLRACWLAWCLPSRCKRVLPDGWPLPARPWPVGGPSMEEPVVICCRSLAWALRVVWYWHCWL
jgi:hypothetical protein